jgi:prepilin-type N-terminal cleavage/methylation domain-containing protein
MHNKKITKRNRGFTLVEIMVAVTIFSVVMVISMGSIIGVFNANYKSKSLRSVMDNLNLTLESMTRTIRFGTNYHCGTSVPTTSPLDCGGAGNSNLTVRAQNGAQTTYFLSGGRIMRTVGSNTYAMTSPDVTITTLTFWVYGSAPYSGGTNLLQPQVIIVISGYVGTKTNTRSYFTLQTTISQRVLDFN